jgi:hypothetical protein
LRGKEGSITGKQRERFEDKRGEREWTERGRGAVEREMRGKEREEAADRKKGDG